MTRRPFIQIFRSRAGLSVSSWAELLLGLDSRFPLGLNYFSGWTLGFLLGWTTSWAGLSVTFLGWHSRLLLSTAPFGWYSSQVGGCTCKSLRCQSQKQFNGFSDKITLTFFLCWPPIYRVSLMGLLQYFWTFFLHLFIIFTPTCASSLFKLGFIIISIILSGFGPDLSVLTYHFGYLTCSSRPIPLGFRLPVQVSK